jgi:citronellol/citronellal dehydrogenase
MMGLRDKVAIITGASRGIGKVIALALAERGCNVVVAAKSVADDPRLPGTIHDTVREVEERGARGLAVQTDVRDEAAIERLAKTTADTFGRIDFVINNAGALWWRPALETPAKRFDLVMDVNVRASFLLATACAPAMIAQGGGHVLNMSPPVDLLPHPGTVAYTVSKFGMTMVALGLAAEWKKHRISSNALWPATMIESQATINWQMGERRMWRTPDIISDATLALLESDPGTITGRALIDEDFLREQGVTDFRRYRCDPDHEPPRIDYSQIAKLMGVA